MSNQLLDNFDELDNLSLLEKKSKDKEKLDLIKLKMGLYPIFFIGLILFFSIRYYAKSYWGYDLVEGTLKPIGLMSFWMVFWYHYAVIVVGVLQKRVLPTKPLNTFFNIENNWRMLWLGYPMSLFFFLVLAGVLGMLVSVLVILIFLALEGACNLVGINIPYLDTILYVYSIDIGALAIFAGCIKKGYDKLSNDIEDYYKKALLQKASI